MPSTTVLERRDVRRHQGRAEGRSPTGAGAFHHLDVAAAGEPAIALHRSADDDRPPSGCTRACISATRVQVALITYMRTDSTRVSNDALQMVRVHIDRQFRRHVSAREKPNVYKSGKSAQEAHEAIRPTDLATPRSRCSGTSARTSSSSTADLQPLRRQPDEARLSSRSPNVEVRPGQGVFKAQGKISEVRRLPRVWPAAKQEAT
jgi:hypothetical protein